MFGLIGKKIRMTQIFDEKGNFVPVTVIEAGPCPIIKINQKTLLLGFEKVKESKLKKPVLGVFKKTGVTACRIMKELPFDERKKEEYKIGQELKVDIFKEGTFVDITGISKGKGFQGGMKRWGWAGGPKTHGSMSHRRIGSLGSSTTPGRVLKGHHLPGHMGARKVTVQNLKLIKIIPDKNLILVKGAIPGANNNYVIIKKAKKKSNQ
ncbi:MAG: 50S ribosomal protein L3 [Candidatus Omnitrophica bacterium]|nr:50S ribosomal protein L3 [Candidatus Omnitrophota bacterium]